MTRGEHPGVSETFSLEASIGGTSREIPSQVTGTIVFLRALVTPENITAVKESDEFWAELIELAGEDDVRVHNIHGTAILDMLLAKKDSKLPPQIILALDEHNYYANFIEDFIWSAGNPQVVAVISPAGLLSHVGITTREVFKKYVGEINDFTALLRVDTEQLRGGDEATIDLKDGGEAVITVTRIPE